MFTGARGSNRRGGFAIMGLLSLAISLFLSPIVASATEEIAATITNIRIRSNVVYVRFAGCPAYARIYLATDYDKTMVSTALAAAAGGQTVQVQFDRPTGCTIEEPMIVYMDVRY